VDWEEVGDFTLDALYREVLEQAVAFSQAGSMRRTVWRWWT
jgi:hypothetical protein